MKESWVITYYGTGMTPQYKRFDNEEDALLEWDRMYRDPWQGVRSLKHEITIRTR